MTEELNNSLVDWHRRAALEEIEYIKAFRSSAWEEHTNSYRWLMASLLGVNGAACLAVFGSAAVQWQLRFYACGSFILGILAALLVAVFGQHAVQKSLSPLQKLVGYWMTVAEDGQRDDDIEAKLNHELQVSAKIALGSRLSGWVSAIAFLVGITISGFGLEDQNRAGSHIKVEYSEAPR